MKVTALNQEIPANEAPRRAFSIVEVCVAIAILGSSMVALSSGFRGGDGIVQAGNDVSWAMRLAEQQADLVRTKLQDKAPPTECISSPNLVLDEWNQPAPNDVGANAPFGKYSVGVTRCLRTLGCTQVPIASDFYLLNSTNTNPPEALDHVLRGQFLRLQLYMTEVNIGVRPAPYKDRDARGRKVVACQIDVFKGIPGTVANDATGGNFLFSMSFLARRYDLDGPTAPRSNGFFTP